MPLHQELYGEASAAVLGAPSRCSGDGFSGVWRSGSGVELFRQRAFGLLFGSGLEDIRQLLVTAVALWADWCVMHPSWITHPQPMRGRRWRIAMQHELVIILRSTGTKMRHIMVQKSGPKLCTKAMQCMRTNPRTATPNMPQQHLQLINNLPTIETASFN